MSTQVHTTRDAYFTVMPEGEATALAYCGEYDHALDPYEPALVLNDDGFAGDGLLLVIEGGRKAARAFATLLQAICDDDEAWQDATDRAAEARADHESDDEHEGDDEE